MACLLKAPSEGSKGVVVFTTQERDNVIRTDTQLAEQIAALKDRWLIGLHHNWHDYAFVYDPLYDFSMAGEDDLREVSGKRIPLIPLDACNFVPAYFGQAPGDPFWDLLYIARPVGFKRLPEFLNCIRSLFNQGHDYRVLLVSPMPPYRRSERATVFYDLRRTYEAMFSRKEQERFTLLDPSFNYPFPFDLETIAHFYRSSRTFVHFADDERRCRVAAYAWATGIPVIATSDVGSLLPERERHPPAFYEVRDISGFPDRIVEAIDNSSKSSDERRFFSEAATVPVLVENLEALLETSIGAEECSRMALESLGIRLGRHHGLSEGPNRVPMDLTVLVELLTNGTATVAEPIERAPDPELELVRLTQSPPRRRRWPGGVSR